MRTPAFLMMNN